MFNTTSSRLRLGCLGVLTAATLAAPVAAAEDRLFGEPTVLFKSGTSSTAAADFTSDGRSEFVVATRGVRLFRWDDKSRSMIQSTITETNGGGHGDRYGGDLAAADIDGDGHIDLIVPNSNNKLGPGDVFWYRNPGAVKPGDHPWPRKTITSWSGQGDKNAENFVAHMSEIEAGDFDGDGDIDVVTRDVSFGLFILINQGKGKWTRRHIPVNPREGLALHDMDGDGDLDIVINGIWLETPGSPKALADLTKADFTKHVYDLDDANGDNQYPRDGERGALQNYAKKVKVADMNGDGRADIIVANSEQLGGTTGGGPKGIRIYFAPAKRGEPWREVILSAPQVKLEERFSLHTLEIGDLDGDGHLDILSAISSVGRDNAPGEIFALINKGDAQQFTFHSIYKGGYAYNNVIGDADCDGRPDLFGGTGFSSGDVRYFPNVSKGSDSAR